MANFSISDENGRSSNFDVPDGMSPADLAKALADSLKGPVGKATPYNKGKSPEQQRAIEQLKQIEKFNDGLSEANESLKNILSVLATKGSGGSRGSTVRGFSNGRGYGGGSSGEVGIGEAGSARVERTMTNISHSAHDITNEMRLMKGHAGTYGTKLKLLKGDFAKILGDLETKIHFDKEDAALMERGLANFHKMNAEQRDFLQKRAHDLQKIRVELDAMADGQSKDYAAAKYEDRLRDFVRNMSYAANASMTTMMDRLRSFGSAMSSVAKTLTVKDLVQVDFHLDPGQMADESVKWLRDINQAMFDATGNAEDMRKSQKGFYTDIYKLGLDIENIYAETGQTAAGWRKELMIMTRQGMRGGKQLENTVKAGLSLAHLIGTDATATTQEIGGWVQGFDLSNAAAMNLTANIRQVGRMTGITGESLLQATQNARALAKQMFNFGMYSEAGTKSLIGLSAQAKRMGTENKSNEIMMGLMGQQNLYERTSPGMRAFMVRAASQGGVMNQLQNGEVLNDAGSKRSFAGGMRGSLNNFLGMMGVSNVSQLKGQNLISANNFAKGNGFDGIIELERTIKSFENSALSIEDKIASITKDIATNVYSTKELEDLNKEVELLRAGKTKEEFTDAITKLIDESRSGVNVEDKLRNAVDMLNRNTKKKITEKQIGEALAKGPTGFKDLLEDVSKALQDSDLEDKQKGLDPATAATRTLADQMLAMQKQVEALRLVTLTQTELVVRANTEAIVDLMNKLMGFKDEMVALKHAVVALSGVNAAKMLAPGGMGGGAGALGVGLIGAGLVATVDQRVKADKADTAQYEKQVLDHFGNQNGVAQAALDEQLKKTQNAFEQKIILKQKELTDRTNQVLADSASWDKRSNDKDVQIQRGLGGWFKNQLGYEGRKEQKAQDAEMAKKLTDEALSIKGEQEGLNALRGKQNDVANAREAFRLKMGSKAGDEAWNKYFTEAASKKMGQNFANYHYAVMGVSPEAGKAIFNESNGMGPAGGVESLDDLGIKTKSFNDAMLNMNDLAAAGLKPGSIYVHDTHLEDLLKNVPGYMQTLTTAPMEMALARPEEVAVAVAEQLNQSVLHRRIETEFAGIDVDATMHLANDLLAQIAYSNKEQVDLMRQQIGALMAVVRSLGGAAGPAGSTTNPVVPLSTPSYYQWNMRQMNMANFGGVENYVRG